MSDFNIWLQGSTMVENLQLLLGGFSLSCFLLKELL